MTNDIELIDIESALKDLGETEKGRNRSHASLFTLVLYTRKGERDLYFQKSMDAILSKFPCRLIAVTREKEAKSPYLRTKVSTTPLSKALFCEKIMIEVGGEYEDRVPSIILPHLLADLPLFLIWSDVPDCSNPLVPLAKRIIIDSEITNDFQKCSKTLLALEEKLPCDMGDLTWASLRSWRRLFAEIFKDEEWQESLRQTKKITLTYNCAHSLSCVNEDLRSFYFQGWLASHLNWKFQKYEKKEKGFLIDYLSPSGSVEVIIEPSAEIFPLPSGALVKLTLDSKKSDGLFIFNREKNPRQLFLNYSDKNRCLVPLYLRLGGALEGEEIIEELFYPSLSSSYLKTLKLLSDIPWKAK